MFGQTTATIVVPFGFGMISLTPVIAIIVFAIVVYIIYTVVCGKKSGPLEQENLFLDKYSLPTVDEFLEDVFVGKNIKVGLGDVGEDLKTYGDDMLVEVVSYVSDPCPSITLIFRKLGKVGVSVVVLDELSEYPEKYPPLFNWDYQNLSITFSGIQINGKKLVLRLDKPVEIPLVPRWDGND